MKYQFNLGWEELPEEFREEKIREYILAGDKRDCGNCDGLGKLENHDCRICGGTGKVDPDPDDIHQQDEAEEDIRVHFPIYF
jgi:RecJ-like exonuclease